MERLQEAIHLNEIIQKKKKKDTYTKPNLFFSIESFIQKKKLIGYGGTAINHALPKESKFYQEDDIPDYDFFSTQPTEDIRELADLLTPHFPNVEVKPAMFPGTYKLFVNYLPLVDITHIDEELFHTLWADSFQKEGIRYVPYNYLRMSMYQELARPMGDISRWTKIFQRLSLLNKHHPFLIRNCNVKPSEKIPSSIVKGLHTRIKDYVCLGDYAMYYWQELFPSKFQYAQQDVVYILSDTIDEIWKKLKGLEVRFTFYENKLIKLYEIYIENYPCEDAKINEYLLQHKNELITRGIRKFTEKNWFEWGAPRNIDAINSNKTKDCIYIYNLTRKSDVSFLGKVSYFGGGLIMLKPKKMCDLNKIVAYINSNTFKANFMFSGRFKIGHRQICNSYIPNDYL
jgi:hypothetical protein